MTSPLFIEEDTGARLNLYDGTIKVIDGWFPQAAGDDPNAPIWETIPLIFEGTSAQITAALLDLRDKLRKARDYQKDLLTNVPIYLGMEYDAVEAHSCILKSSLKPVPKIGTQPYLDTANSQVKAYVLRVLRVPYWEEQTADSQAATDIHCWGGTQAFTNSEGTRDARIFKSYVSGLALGKVWLGWRKERGGLTYFKPRFEIEDGDIIDSADTTFAEDANASYRTPASNNITQTVFTTLGNNVLTERVRIDIADHMGAEGDSTAFSDNYRGRYLVIANLKGSNNTTKFGVQLRHGYRNSIAVSSNQEILFQDDSWRATPLGMITLPSNPQHDASETFIDNNLEKYRFQMWAERISGTGNLLIDGFVLMPTDHLVTITKNPNITSGIGRYYLYSRADGKPGIVGASIYPTGIPDQLSEASFENWKIPLDSSKLVYIREFGALDADSGVVQTYNDDLMFYWKSAWDDYFVSRT